VPYELSDALTARTKVENAETVITWRRRTVSTSDLDLVLVSPWALAEGITS
jgi:hypothetical protein